MKKNKINSSKTPMERSITTLVLLVLGAFVFILLISVNRDFYNFFYQDLKLKSVNYLKLSPITLEAIKSPSSLQMLLFAKLKYNLYFRLSLILLPIICLFALKQKRKADQKKYQAILDEFELYKEIKSFDSKGQEKVERIYPQIFINKEKPGEFFIKELEDGQRNNLEKMMNGFLSSLKEAGHIEYSEGILEFQDRPRYYAIKLMTPDYIAQLEMENFLTENNLFKIETLGKRTIKKFPKVEFNDQSDLIITCDGFHIENIILTRALSSLKERFITDELKEKGIIGFFFVKKTNQIGRKYIYTCYSSRNPSFVVPYGKYLVDYHDAFNERIVKEIRRKFYDEGVLYWYLGASRDSGYRVPQEFIVSSIKLPHLMIGGNTGSGKTEFLKLVMNTTISALKEEVEIYCANGSPTTLDLDPFAERYSSLGIRESAKINSKGELSQLVSILERMVERANERKNYFQKLSDILDVPIGDAVSYRMAIKDLIKNQDNIYTEEQINSVPHKLTEVILFADEFGGFTQVMDYEANFNKVGTVAYYFNIILTQYRKFGIRCCLATQQFRAKHIPRPLFSLISGITLFRVEDADIAYLRSSLDLVFDNVDPVQFEVGQGVSINVVKCELTNRSIIPMSSYYIGRGTPLNRLLDLNDCDIYKEYKPYFEELKNITGKKIYSVPDYNKAVSAYLENSDQDNKSNFKLPLSLIDKKEDYKAKVMLEDGVKSNFSTLTKEQMQAIIKDCMLEKEGWEIIKVNSPSFRIYNLYAYNPETKMKVSVGFVESSELSQMGAEKVFRKDREKDSEIEDVDQELFFIIGEKGDDKKIYDNKMISNGFENAVFLNSVRYKKPLTEAYHRYVDIEGEGYNENIFQELIGESATSQRENISKLEIDKREKMIMKFDNKVHWNKLHDIINSSATATEKGDLFEAFYISFERFHGFDTVSAAEIKSDPRLKFDNKELQLLFKKTKNKREEFGLDAFRWTDRENLEGIIFQLKNQRAPVDSTIVEKMTMTRDIYAKAGLKIKNIVLVTTGTVNDSAKMRIMSLGYKYVDISDIHNYYDPDSNIYESFIFKLDNQSKKNPGRKALNAEAYALEREQALQDMELLKAEEEPENYEKIQKAISQIKNDKLEQRLNPETRPQKTEEQIKKKEEEIKIISKIFKDDIEANKAKKDSQKDIIEADNRENITKKEKFYKEETISILDEINSEEAQEVESNSDSNSKQESTEESSKISVMLENVIGKVNRPYYSIDEWESFRSIPKSKDRKEIKSAFKYVRLSGSKITMISVNDKKSKKMSTETKQKINNALKILAEYKIKSLHVEVFYQGETTYRNFGQNVRLINCNGLSEETLKSMLLIGR